jgi:hypothetical protein
MTESNPAEAGNMREPQLPRRDWILLPMLSLLTTVLLILGTELIARLEFSDSATGLAPCLILNDISTGVRGVPNSECWAKATESSWTEYKFNSCGHRAGMECGPKDPGSYRVVMTGSSMAMGLYVAREKSIAGRLPWELSRLTGRKIELYNASIGAAYGGTPHSVALRFNEVLAAKPDMILWLLTTWDLDHVSDLRPQEEYLRAVGRSTSAHSVSASFQTSALGRAAAKVGAESIADLLYEQLKAFRFRVLLTHYLFMSQSLYVKSYLKNEDDAVGFLKADWGPDWRERINEFDGYAANIEEQSKAAGIPLVVVLVPNRAQAAMISMGEWPEGYDPYKIDNELRAVIMSHGGIYVDIFPAFRTIPNPENLYLPVDGHPDAEGHAMISGLLAKVLTSGVVPDLRAATQQQAALEKTK